MTDELFSVNDQIVYVDGGTSCGLFWPIHR